MRKKTKQPTSETHSRSVAYAKEYVDSLALPEVGPPRGAEPEWPGHLAEVDDNDLAHHMAYWTGMLAYIGDHVAIADAERKVFEMQEETLIAKHTLECIEAAHQKIRDEEYNGTRVTATDKASRTSYTVHRLTALMMADVQQTRIEYLKYYARWKLLAVRQRDYEQYYQSTSREISRREYLRTGERRST